mmetsp:Transcript_93983/g.271678  ORF Transcript_93983/g.271678 Transcript_93983/m.271678 type:complete len:206 (-) Transcript_93983:229-846(-)
MSHASTRAATRAAPAKPPQRELTSQRRSTVLAFCKMSYPRSSRPLHFKLATEFKRAMYCTSCRSVATARSWVPAPRVRNCSRNCASQPAARTTSCLARSSMAMRSLMYMHSNFAQATSNLPSMSTKSRRAVEGGCSSASSDSQACQRSMSSPRANHVCCNDSACRTACGLNSNFSPLTQIDECRSKLVSSTSTRYNLASPGNNAR